MSTQAQTVESVSADEKADIRTIGDLEVELRERIDRPASREKVTFEQHIKNGKVAEIKTRDN